MTWRAAFRTALTIAWLTLLLPLQTGATCGGISYETGGEGDGCQSAALIAAAVVGGLTVAVTAGVVAYRYFSAIKTITDLSVGLSTHLPARGEREINWNHRSVPTFGHTFTLHGRANTKELVGRAAGTGDAQGQWLDDQAAAVFLREHYDPAATERYVVDLPAGLGLMIMPDGTRVPAPRARIVPNRRGIIRVAYPTLETK
ncbi:hypothetical protein ACQP00_25175 [Dactylosporangium sp. CS-047395]|uniref:hypothetical protein n=1 Tax=Dactylosporangium sp. CS-047395 TaxID=3239936 RepID=UPI003D94E6FA